MKRRSFWNSVPGTTAFLAGIGGVDSHRGEAATLLPSATDRGKLGGKTLVELRNEYRYWLFDDFLPFMDRYIIDHEWGGFMCAVDRDGTQLSSDKFSWFIGRGIWVYSFLYKNLEPDPKYLEVARKAVEFLIHVQHAGDGFLPNNFKKDGTPAPDSKPDIDGDLYMALGLQEYGRIKGNEQYWYRAKEIFLKLIHWYDSPGFECNYSYTAPNGKPPSIQAPRVLGYWMDFLNISARMLEFKKDSEIEAFADRAIDAIMKKHFNPDYALINEVINHDMSRNKDFEQISYLGHAIEALWMVMYEAVRRKDKTLFNAAADQFKRHVEVAWDDVYGGAFRALYHVNDNLWAVDKVTWLQEEILIGTMAMIGYTGSQWAKEWFGKTYSYAMEKLALKRYGFPLWVDYSDRKVIFVRHANRCENYHHPRHLMFNLIILDALVKRKDNVLELFFK